MSNHRANSKPGRPERTKHGVRQYEVKSFWRKFPGPPQPHWIAVRVQREADLDGEYSFLAQAGWAPDHCSWTDDIDKAPSYLRNQLKKLFHAEMEAGTIHLLQVD